ncbi:unnamed protein product [Brassica oleracea]
MPTTTTLLHSVILILHQRGDSQILTYKKAGHCSSTVGLRLLRFCELS